MNYKTLTITFTSLAFIFLVASPSARRIAAEIGSDYITTGMSLFLLVFFSGFLALYFFTMYDGKREEGEGEQREAAKSGEDTAEYLYARIEEDENFLKNLGFNINGGNAVDVHHYNLALKRYNIALKFCSKSRFASLYIYRKNQMIFDAYEITKGATRRDVMTLIDMLNRDVLVAQIL